MNATRSTPNRCHRCQGHGWVWPSAQGTATHKGTRYRIGVIGCPACLGTGRATATNRGVSAAEARELAIIASVSAFGTPAFRGLCHDAREAIVDWMAAHPTHPAVVEAVDRVVADIGLDPAVLLPLLFPRKPDAAPDVDDGSGSRAGARPVDRCDP